MRKRIIILVIPLVLTGCENNNKKVLEKNNDYINNSSSEEIVSVTEEDKFLDVNNNDISIDSDYYNKNIDDKQYQENNEEILVEDNNITCEEDVVNYFHKLKEKIIEKVNSDTWENVKQTVIETLDIAYGFCFNGEEIGGYTLNELSNSAKEKILTIVFDIDSFIESKSPGYKQSFKESYNTMIDSAKEGLGIIKDKIINVFDNKE